MLRLLLLITCCSVVTSHPTSCTEDFQCSSGFYCEENAHVCRECLNCAEFKRESPLPHDLCIKSVLQCGACLKGLVADTVGGHDTQSVGCMPPVVDEGAPHAYLPAYAWAAIAIGSILMVATLCLFLKTKTFKVIAYSSRTSVQSLRAAETVSCQPLAPPPYNYLLPQMIPPGSTYENAPEIQRLVDSPQMCKRNAQEGSMVRPREGSSSQAARVYNHPAYVRMPQNTSFRCNSPERPTSPPEEDEMGVATVATTPEELTNNVNVKLDNDYHQIVTSDSGMSCGNASEQISSRGCAKEQDSNNNKATSDRSPSQEAGSDAPCRDAYIIGGPSFVINVVENISNLRQRNETTFCRSNDTTD